MHKRWVSKQQGEAEKVEELARLLNVTNDLSNLLVQRGIYTYEAARSFFRPELKDLHDPFLMADMVQAVERIQQAILNQ